MCWRAHRPEEVVARDERRDRPRGPGGSAAARAPPRADRLLLPHARVVLRRRGRGAGDTGASLARARRLRGALGAAVVALPDRDQRLPGPALRPASPRAADGPLAQPEPPGGELARRPPAGHGDGAAAARPSSSAPEGRTRRSAG